MGKSVSSINVLVGANIKDFTRKMDTVSQKLKKNKIGYVDMAKSIGAVVGAAMLGAAAASVKMAVTFESSLTRMRTLVGLSAKEVDGFKDKILDLAGETGKAPEELADAMYFIVSSGLEGAEALDALEASAKASALGMGEMGEIADATTSVMNAYGSSVYGAEKVTNLLLKTVKVGKVEADALAGSIGRVIPTAATMGVSFEEVGAALATMSLTGSDAAEATTALNSLLTSLLNPTEKAQKVMDKLGTSAGELRDQISEQGLQKTLLGLKEKLGGNVEATGMLFKEKRSLKAMLSLTGAQTLTYIDILKDMKTATDDVGDGTKILAKTTEHKYNQMSASISKARIALGDFIINTTYAHILAQSPVGNPFWEDQKKGAEEATKAAKSWIGQVYGSQNPGSFPGMVNPAGTFAGTTKEIDLDDGKEPKTKKGKFSGQRILNQKELLDLLEEEKKYNQQRNTDYAKVLEYTNAYIDANTDSNGVLRRMNGEMGEIKNTTDKVVEGYNGLAAGIDDAAKAQDDLNKKTATYSSVVESLGNALMMAEQTQTDNLNDEFNEREQAINHKYDLEADRINEVHSKDADGARYSDQLKGMLDNNRSKELKKNDQERSSMMKKQAEDEKNLALFLATVRGAAAIAKAWEDYGYPLAIPITVAVAAETQAVYNQVAGAPFPAFAAGGFNSQGGTALVGERGPELINLPRSARVTPNHQLNGMGGGGLHGEFDREKMIVWTNEGDKHHSFRKPN